MISFGQSSSSYVEKTYPLKPLAKTLGVLLHFDFRGIQPVLPSSGQLPRPMVSSCVPSKR